MDHLVLWPLPRVNVGPMHQDSCRGGEGRAACNVCWLGLGVKDQELDMLEWT